MKKLALFIILSLLTNYVSFSQEYEVYEYFRSERKNKNVDEYEDPRLKNKVVIISVDGKIMDVFETDYASVARGLLDKPEWIAEKIGGVKSYRKNATPGPMASLTFYRFYPESSESGWSVYQKEVRTSMADPYSFTGWKWYGYEVDSYYVIHDDPDYDNLVGINSDGRDYYFHVLFPDYFFEPVPGYYYFKFDAKDSPSRPSYMPEGLYVTMPKAPTYIEISRYGRDRESEYTLNKEYGEDLTFYHGYISGHEAVCLFNKGRLEISVEGRDPLIYKNSSIPSQNTGSSGGSYVPAPVYSYPSTPTYNSGTSSSSSTKIQTRKVWHDCPQCKGKGTVPTELFPTTFGMSNVKVWCSECGKYYLKDWGHTHVTCPQCHGKKGYYLDEVVR